MSLDSAVDKFASAESPVTNGTIQNSKDKSNRHELKDIYEIDFETSQSRKSSKMSRNTKIKQIVFTFIKKNNSKRKNSSTESLTSESQTSESSSSGIESSICLPILNSKLDPKSLKVKAKRHSFGTKLNISKRGSFLKRKLKQKKTSRIGSTTCTAMVNFSPESKKFDGENQKTQRENDDDDNFIEDYTFKQPSPKHDDHFPLQEQVLLPLNVESWSIDSKEQESDDSELILSSINNTTDEDFLATKKMFTDPDAELVNELSAGSLIRQMNSSDKFEDDCKLTVMPPLSVNSDSDCSDYDDLNEKTLKESSRSNSSLSDVSLDSDSNRPKLKFITGNLDDSLQQADPYHKVSCVLCNLTTGRSACLPTTIITDDSDTKSSEVENNAKSSFFIRMVLFFIEFFILVYLIYRLDMEMQIF